MDDELAQVPEEFRPACGRPGSHVIVRYFPVTIPHALCDLTGVAISYPRGIPADRPPRDPGRQRGRAAPAGRTAPVRRSASAHSQAAVAASRARRGGRTAVAGPTRPNHWDGP